MPRALITVSGMVQGVSFRHFVKTEATHMGLTGTVKNLANGDVQIIAAGRREAIEALIAKVGRGNRSSRVDGCEVVWDRSDEEYLDFRIVF